MLKFKLYLKMKGIAVSNFDRIEYNLFSIIYYKNIFNTRRSL